MEEIYCNGCGKKLNPIPFVGDKIHKFKEGTYCQTCAEIKVKKERQKI